jgi:hypothetical protein
MEVPSFSSPRGKRGQFTKGRAQKDSSSTPNLLLALGTVALATGAGASADSLTQPALPRAEPQVAQPVELARPQKKRRRSDEHQLLNEHRLSERYAATSLKHDGEHHLVADRCLTQGDPYKRLKRAVKAIEARNTFVIDADGDMFECTSTGSRMKGEGLQASRRSAIAYFFEHIYGNPGESEWHGRGGILGKVMLRLEIPPTSVHCVRKVFEDVSNAIKNSEVYDPHSGPRERGRDVAIEKQAREGTIIFYGMKSGIGITETTVLVNGTWLRCSGRGIPRPSFWSPRRR